MCSAHARAHNHARIIFCTPTLFATSSPFPSFFSTNTTNNLSFSLCPLSRWLSVFACVCVCALMMADVTKQRPRTTTHRCDVHDNHYPTWSTQAINNFDSDAPTRGIFAGSFPLCVANSHSHRTSLLLKDLFGSHTPLQLVRKAQEDYRAAQARRQAALVAQSRPAYFVSRASTHDNYLVPALPSHLLNQSSSQPPSTTPK